MARARFACSLNPAGSCPHNFPRIEITSGVRSSGDSRVKNWLERSDEPIMYARNSGGAKSASGRLRNSELPGYVGIRDPRLLNDLKPPGGCLVLRLPEQFGPAKEVIPGLRLRALFLVESERHPVQLLRDSRPSRPGRFRLQRRHPLRGRGLSQLHVCHLAAPARPPHNKAIRRNSATRTMPARQAEKPAVGNAAGKPAVSAARPDQRRHCSP